MKGARNGVTGINFGRIVLWKALLALHPLFFIYFNTLHNVKEGERK